MRRLLISVISIVAVTGALLLVEAQAPPPKVCGDGVLQNPNDAGVNEDCDDGNRTNADGCNDAQANGCRFVCGDKTVSAPNADGVNEWCDEAGDTALCTASCGVKLLGWGWASTFGWLSLSSANCSYFLEPNQPAICTPATNYYVQVDTGNNLSGYAWSNNIGWVCFGATCSGTPPYGSLGAPVTVSGEPGQEPTVSGWAQATAYGDRGWFSLNCSDPGVCGQSSYEVRLGSDHFYENDDAAELTRPTLIGYAWHNYAEGGGLGWVQFNPAVGIAWLQTRLGDIYAGGRVEGDRPQGVFNATYRILANGDVTFGSQSGVGTPWVDPNYGPIDFPTPQTRYSNLLGKIDLDGLICPMGLSDSTCTNSYGQTVTKIRRGNDLNLANNNPLGGNIYYYPGPGTLTIDNPVAFKNQSAFGYADGSGLIIVNGDLVIKSEVTYEAALALNKFKNLASVAWLVQGDISINGSVTQAAGAFMALGDGVTRCPNAGCGIFSSGSSANFLTVSGLVMARTFSFGRTAASPLRGSELIIYDGRLLANIPPGLADFAEALPIWRSGTFAP